MRTQIDDIIISLFPFSFIQFKPWFHQQIILQISIYTFLNSNIIPHKANVNVLVKNNSNKWGLSNPTDESKDLDF
jgi:hypothetical protein